MGFFFCWVFGVGFKEVCECVEREIRDFCSQMVYQFFVFFDVVDIVMDIYREVVCVSYVKGCCKYNVVVVCMYVVCCFVNQKQIMFFDLVDIVKIDVFFFGCNYKEFMRWFFIFDIGYDFFILENLIFCFVVKLEFFYDINKVVNLVFCIVYCMVKDNISIGCWFVGIFGVVIIMVVCVYNFWCIVWEVVYVVKVMMVILQECMFEFVVVFVVSFSIRQFM